MNKVYGLWYGGASYSYGDMDSLEVFDSITDAKWQLAERYHSNGKRPVDFKYADGREFSTYTPAVTESSTIQLFFYDPREDNNGPDRVLYFGPRMGVRESKKNL